MIKQYGDWQQAKTILEGISEPKINLTKQDKDGVCIDLAPILGYPVQYAKKKVKKGMRAYLTIMNPVTNGCYMRDLCEVVSEEAGEYFK